MSSPHPISARGVLAPPPRAPWRARSQEPLCLRIGASPVTTPLCSQLLSKTYFLIMSKGDEACLKAFFSGKNLGIKSK